MVSDDGSCVCGDVDSGRRLGDGSYLGEIMKFKITSRWSGEILFSLETGALKLAVEAAVKSDANLRDADLRGANLGGANLGGANLGGANLGGANLRDADLGGANLRDADLGGANLRDANLRDANLRDADLRGANLGDADLGDADLGGADLRGANLGDANLRDANLRDANLTIIRDDIWAILSSAPSEVVGLRQAIIDGKIDGSTYEGECACLVGTMANVRHCNYYGIPTLRPDSSRPAERFFLAISPGDTPDKSQVAKLALEWVDLWLSNVQGAFAPEVKS